MTVLLIDNDVEFRDQLTDALDRFGIDLLWRARILGLLDAVANNEPEAVILSADLPGGDALELVRAIRRQGSWSDLPVFIVGNSPDRAFELRAYAEGADAILLRNRATAEITARLLGLSSIENRRRRGTAKSIADAALALCPLPGDSSGVVPTTRALYPSSRSVVPSEGPMPGAPVGYPPAPEYGPAQTHPPVQGMTPQDQPQAPRLYPQVTSAILTHPHHTAIHAPPNGQFIPPDGVVTPQTGAQGLGPDYRGSPPLRAGGGRHGTPPETASPPDVILVEDDPSLLEMLRYALANRGFTTLSFSNGLDALRALCEMETDGRHPVVLLDVDLPGLDGFRILHELSGARPGVFQVILCTVHSSEATQVLGIQSGAVDYIVKPLRMPIVLAKVERLLGRNGISAAAGSS